jgi:hypothetical protein
MPRKWIITTTLSIGHGKTILGIVSLSLASLVGDNVLVPVAGVEAFLKALQKEVDSKSAGSDEPAADTDKMEE